jgi:transposase InsO family protein
MGHETVLEQLKVLNDDLWQVGGRLTEAGCFQEDPVLFGDYKRTNKQLGKTLRRGAMSKPATEMLVSVQRLLERCWVVLDEVAPLDMNNCEREGCVRQETVESSDIYAHPLQVMRASVDRDMEAGEGDAIPLGTPVMIGTHSKGERDAAFRTRVLALVSGGISLRDAAHGLRGAIQGKSNVDVDFIQAVAPLSAKGRQRYKNLNERTISRWRQKVQALQLAAGPGCAAPSVLKSLSHRNVSARQPRKATVALVEAVRKLALEKRTNHLSAVLIAEELEGQGYGKVSHSLVRRILRTKLTQIEWHFYRFGWKGVAQGFDSKLNREARFPNQVWLMDHSFLPQEVIAGTGDESGSQDCDLEIDVRVDGPKGVRRLSNVHCTMIKDAYSRRTLALRLWDKHPTARETLLVLRDAMQRFGSPITLYTDNGADFLSNDVQGLLVVAGVAHSKTRPYEPEGRGKIERAFGTLKNRLLRNIPGYRGKDCSYQWGDDDLLTLPDLERQLLARVVEYERKQPHSETKRCPEEMFESDRLANSTVYTPGTQEALLSLLLIARVKRTAGGVKFEGRTYDSEHLGIVQHGRDVTLHYDPADPRTVHFSLPGKDGDVVYLGEGIHYSRENPPPPVGEQKRRMRRVQTTQIRPLKGAEEPALIGPGPDASALLSGPSPQAELALPGPVTDAPDTAKPAQRVRSRTAARAAATSNLLTLY